MPYPQDLVGKYINYKIDPGGFMKVSMRGELVNGVLPGKTTAATVAVYTGVLPVTGVPPVTGHSKFLPRALHTGVPPVTGQGAMQVTNTNLPWTFTFLKYFGGAVTVAPLMGPVLTGPMSGCYLCKYNQGGQKLAHIGTVNTQNSPGSIAAKQAWVTFVARTDVSMVKGGSPADYFHTSDHLAATFETARAQDKKFPSVVGYFAGGAAYAMLLASVPVTKNPPGLHLMKVASLKTMTMQPWSSIKAMRRFRL